MGLHVVALDVTDEKLALPRRPRRRHRREPGRTPDAVAEVFRK